MEYGTGLENNEGTDLRCLGSPPLISAEIRPPLQPPTPSRSGAPSTEPSCTGNQAGLTVTFLSLK